MQIGLKMEAGDCPTLNMNAKENYLLSQSLKYVFIAWWTFVYTIVDFVLTHCTYNQGKLDAINNYRPRSWEIMHLVASVRLSVRPCVCCIAWVSGAGTFSLKVFVCVSVISGHMRIIARMRSIGVLIFVVFTLMCISIFIVKSVNEMFGIHLGYS